MSYFKVIGLLVVLVVYIAASALTATTLAPKELDELAKQKSAVANSDGKDMKGYIAEIWDAKIIPEFAANAIDLDTTIAALKKDASAFEKSNGKRNNEFSPYNYIVKGRAVVKEVKTNSAAGKIILDVKDISGKRDVIIQVGPVIQKSSIRDALSFINFNDFVNQIEFASVSKEINQYILNNVLKDIKDKKMAGKEVQFVGAFTYDKSGKILITPVKIILEGE